MVFTITLFGSSTGKKKLGYGNESRTRGVGFEPLDDLFFLGGQTLEFIPKGFVELRHAGVSLP